MDIRTLELVKNQLTNEKLIAESRLESFLMDRTLDPQERVDKIKSVLQDITTSNNMISVWNDFIEKNVVIDPNNKNKE
jgi:hypothetical protein